MLTTNGYVLLSDLYIEESTDYLTKLKIGSGNAPELHSDPDLDTPYTDNGFETATVTGVYSTNKLTFTVSFTNNGIIDRPITEIGLFSTSGVLVYRRLFCATAMKNLGIVPPGKTVTFVIELDFSESAIVVNAAYNGYTMDFTLYISGSVTDSMDLTTFATPANICYNGVVLPNAKITKLGENIGAGSWEFSCVTKIKAQVDALKKYACPTTIVKSATGKQAVTSSYRSGCLAIKNLETGEMDKFSNVYMLSPLDAVLIKDTWKFSVSVVQSAYAEVL